MTQEEIKKVFNQLVSMPAETEVVEFKEAKNTYDFTKLGKYFSALSNEANLKGLNCAWLVFGVVDKTHKIVGSNYRPIRKDLDHLKGEIANKTTNRISFIEIYELNFPEGRVVLFQIPPAPQGIPIAYDGHYFARDGEELVALNIHKLETIRNQSNSTDWSAVIIPDADIDSLDKKAIDQARIHYKAKFPDKAAEVDSWDDVKFLNVAKITIKGKITRTAILLLGKDESEHYLSPAEAKIRWVLKDAQNNERDYSIEGCPLLLAVDKK